VCSVGGKRFLTECCCCFLDFPRRKTLENAEDDELVSYVGDARFKSGGLSACWAVDELLFLERSEYLRIRIFLLGCSSDSSFVRSGETFVVFCFSAFGLRCRGMITRRVLKVGGPLNELLQYY
jgi:hypothetical protein